ncbi:MAG: oxidoreductase, partial [Microbacteriaceae bacterium]|nr:oxidoreductase [Microbacteriaceae bacterium]
ISFGHFLTAHPFSLSLAPNGNQMRISVGSLGDHTSQFRHLRRGTVVFAEGPFGVFTAARSARKKILLVAGGAGIGPIRALAEDFVKHGRDVVVIYRSTLTDELALEHELRALPLKLHTLKGSRRSLGRDPLDARSLRSLVRDIGEREVYLCGPAGMADTVEHSLISLGLARRMIHREELSMA